MAGVLVVGSLILDMVITAPRFPAPGGNVHGTGFAMVAGGKGANQAVAAARLGEDSLLMGCVGEDAFGDHLLGSLPGAGVDATHVKRVRTHPTGVALIVIEESTGLNTIVVDPGANMALSTSDLDALDPFYERAGTALFQFEIPLEVVAEGARRASEHGLVTVLDAGPPRGANIEIARLFDVVSPNLAELGELAGRETRDLKSALAAAKELARAGINRLVVKMGEQGALLVTREGTSHLPAFQVDAVDSTGAGDAFTAGLAVALSEGIPDEEAVRFANAAGAAAVTVLGAQPSMPGRRAVEELLLRGEAC
jgi:ribokinase